MDPLRLCLLAAVGLTALTVVEAAQANWASVPVYSPAQLSDTGFNFYHYVNVSLGSTAHPTSLVISLGDYLTAVSSAQCFFCPGQALFDPTQSSSFQVNDSTRFSHDSFAFGGVSATDTPFLLLNTYNKNMSSQMLGGLLGLWLDASNSTMQQGNIFKKFVDEGALLNPVIGLRLGPPNARMTIGALDPSDYEGEINWVQATGDAAIDIDGYFGKNGSRIPYKTPLRADLSSISKNLFVPSPSLYFENQGFTGLSTSQIVRNGAAPPGTPEFSYICNGTDGPPTVNISVSINGIKYPVNSKDLLMPSSVFAATSGACNVGIANQSLSIADGSDTMLGVPFLRSVYLAYRLPTGSCPGYYGFAFPSGANATSDVISQTPTAALSASDQQCVALTKPTTKPAPSPPQAQSGVGSGGGSFEVYGRPGDGQVQLKGVDGLGPARVWSAVKP